MVTGPYWDLAPDPNRDLEPVLDRDQEPEYLKIYIFALRLLVFSLTSKTKHQSN